MNGRAGRLLNLDRRIIFLVLAAAVVTPLLWEFELPGLTVSEPTRDMYDAVEALPEGAPILISIDFDPASRPELYPMARVLLEHAFRKDLRVVVMGLWPTGLGLAEQLLDEVSAEYGAEYGEDYAFLGWRPGQAVVIINMGESVLNTYDTDYRGNSVRELAVMQGLRSLRDFDLVVSLSAGFPGIREWVLYGGRYQFPLAGGATGVIAPELYPYYDSGQLVGLMGGLKGAAEYEHLAEFSGEATSGMAALSTAHFTIVALVIFSNILYFLRRERPRAR